MVQGPNTGHEDMAHPRTRCFWPTTHAVSGIAQIPAELGLVFAAHCGGHPLSIACSNGWHAGLSLDFCVGPL